MQKSINNGLIAGGISIMISLVLYLVNKELLFQSWIGSLGTIVLIYFMYSSTKTYLDNSENYTFMGTFQHPFVTGILSLILSTIFAYLLYNVIDPDLNQMMADTAMQKMEGMKSMIGEEAYEKQMESMDPSMLGYSVKTALISLVGGAVVIGIIALIITAIMYNLRRKKQDFA